VNNISPRKELFEKLLNQRRSLIDRIQRLEADLKVPLEADFHEQASQLGQQNILRRLLEVEISNLRRLNFEIEKWAQVK
jgi:hypothetical protein